MKVSKSFGACSYHILLIECLASRTLPLKMFILRIKFNIFFLSRCRDKATLLPNTTLVGKFQNLARLSLIT